MQLSLDNKKYHSLTSKITAKKYDFRIIIINELNKHYPINHKDKLIEFHQKATQFKKKFLRIVR